MQPWIAFALGFVFAHIMERLTVKSRARKDDEGVCQEFE